MADAFIGEIRMFGFNFAPYGWAFCNGQTVPIQQQAALYSIISIIYGGDGHTTFALPNLKGKAPMSAGQGKGLSPRPIGSQGNAAQIALNTNQYPLHNHTAKGSMDAKPESDTPSSQYYPDMLAGCPAYTEDVSATTGMFPLQITGGQTHENRQPFSVVNFCLCIIGYYPPRP